MNRKCEIEDEPPLSDDGKSPSADEVYPASIGKLFSEINAAIIYAVFVLMIIPM